MRCRRVCVGDLELACVACSEKVVADATDDKTGTARAVMKLFVHEHFLSVYGVRSLSDFYLLELLEGIKMFYESHPRCAHACTQALTVTPLSRFAVKLILLPL